MGYAYPEKKSLFDIHERPKFGKLQIENASWLLDAAESLYYTYFEKAKVRFAMILFERGLLLIARRHLSSSRKVLEMCIDIRRRVLQMAIQV